MAEPISERENEIFKVLMQRYKSQWDMNQKTRSNYDEDLEYYLGYRNATDYPLAFNESFNRILPIIYTILSRFMDQIFQSGNIVSVKPRRSENLESAKAVEGLLNYQMESMNNIDMQGGAYLTMYKWFFNCLTFGKGILKTYWRKEERISPKRTPIQVPKFDRMGNIVGMDTIDHMSMESQIIYDGPYCEVLHNKTFIPHPEYKNIQQMPAVFLVYKRTLDEVKKLVDLGVYRREAFDQLGWESAGGAGTEPRDSCEQTSKSLQIEGYVTLEDLRDDFATPEIDILECYTKLILEDEPYEVGSGYTIKGKEEEVIVHIGNYKRILSIQRNVYGVRPLFDIGAYLQPELYWDVGLVRLTKGIQNQVDNLANLRMQNAFMQINQMLRVDPNWDGDPNSLVWRPFGLVEAGQGEIEPIVIPDYASNIFQEQERFFKDTIQDLMGMYDYNMGVTPDRQERVGVVYGIQCLGTFGDDRDYEILTDEGWKKFDDLNRNEKVLTLNYETDEMSWEKPSDYIDGPEDDYELIHYYTPSGEFYCTKNHRLPIEREQRYGKWSKEIVYAGDLALGAHAKIPCSGRKWVGDDSWEVPFGCITKEDWCAFMGIWLSEGHTYYNKNQWSYSIGVSQEKDPEKVSLIDELLTRMPFNFKYNGAQWKVQHKQLYEYLSKYGKSWEKYVPDYIKNSSPELLSIFIEWFFMGDGWYGNSEQLHFTTVSERIANDLQEISIKLGKRASIWKKEKNKINPNWHDVYEVGFSDDKYAWWANNGQKARVEKHRCRITCLTVPNGIFMIRVGNKTMWTGNSMGEARAKLMLMTIDHMGIRPLLKYMMLLNNFHLPNGYEYRITQGSQTQFGRLFAGDMHPDFDYAARYTSMEPALGKGARLQQLMNLAQIMLQNPWINQYQWWRTIFELGDIREADYLLKTPQQYQQEQQAMQQAQMMQAQMGLQAEKAKLSWETEADVFKSNQDYQEETALTEQKFKQDLALTMVEGDLKLEQAKSAKRLAKTA